MSLENKLVWQPTLKWQITFEFNNGNISTSIRQASSPFFAGMLSYEDLHHDQQINVKKITTVLMD